MYTKIAGPQAFNEGAPHINAPGVYGASPMKPILYRIPATGKRPMKFRADLPQGLVIDGNGIISGMCQEGEYTVTVTAENEYGISNKEILFKIVPQGICQTPLMGWTSWNAYAGEVSQENVLYTARAFLEKGLCEYGYQYINIDSDWQGEYGGVYDAIQPNEKFPDMKAMCDEIHGMGLKCGIYSAPMLRCYGIGRNLPGCTRGEMDLEFLSRRSRFGMGVEHCEKNNVKQWTEWGFDYLKYDWGSTDVENAKLMEEALAESTRDFAYCVTTQAKFRDKEYWMNHCNSWRENPDSSPKWEVLKKLCFDTDYWLECNKPGHFFDLDMLETGVIRGNECRLTEDEQLLGYTARIIFPSPIQISCDLSRLTDFDMAMLCNEEVIAVNQDVLGKGAVCIWENKTVGKDYQIQSHVKIYEKELADGKTAVAVFNIGNTVEEITVSAEGCVRDLWAKEDLIAENGSLKLTLHPHTVRLVKKLL